MNASLTSGGSSLGDSFLNIEGLLGSNTGNDTLYGNGEDNHMDGAGGSDQLYGIGGNNTLVGGLGDDTLSAGTGVDIMTGGAGADNFTFTSSSGLNVITDFEDGLDVIEFASVTNVFDLSFVQLGDDVLIQTPAGGASVIVYDSEIVDFTVSDFIF